MGLDFFRKTKQDTPTDQRVHDIDKAHVMAEAEDPEREYLAEFKRYCEDPSLYVQEEHRQAEEAHADGYTMLGNAEDFATLYREGVRSSDLEQLAILAGDRAGREYELEKILKDAGPMKLKILKIGTDWQLKYLEKNLDKATAALGDKIDLTRDPNGVAAAHTLQRLQMSGDDRVNAYAAVFEHYQELADQLARIEARLTGSSSSESIA